MLARGLIPFPEGKARKQLQRRWPVFFACL